MATVTVDLEVGPAIDIEFLVIEGTKVTNSITPTGSKWKISLQFEDITPGNVIHIQLIASGIPGNECVLGVKVDQKDAKLKNPKIKYNGQGFLYFEEKATWKDSSV